VVNLRRMETNMDSQSVVVFVCEHGAAKSVVAAAHFNHLAAERGLPTFAVARGTHPDAEIGAHIAAGLRADGLGLAEQTPQKLQDVDLARADRVITFGSLGIQAPPAILLEQWDNVPPVSDGYEDARDVIVRRVLDLIDDMTTR
jgi:protein-tyrosine-phosphatase